jgi:hypothetical protein
MVYFIRNTFSILLPGIEGDSLLLLFLNRRRRRSIGIGEGEELLVDPLSFVKVGMEIDLGGLDGGMAEVFLDDPEIL